MLAAVILSGGSSSRMGSPKALLAYQGRPFLEHLLEVTVHPKIGVRRVVLGAHAEPIAKNISLAADEIVINENWESGQLSSIQAAIRSLPHFKEAKPYHTPVAPDREDAPPEAQQPHGTDGLLLCLIDHPLISSALVHDLIEQFYTASCGKIVLPLYETRRGHPVIFPAALYEELLRAPTDKGARAVVWGHAADILEVRTNEEGCVLNLNDPETLYRATRPPPD